MYIKDLINFIQKRPLMYVKEERLDYIYQLLTGYCMAASKNNAPSEMDKHFHSWFGKWLYKYWIKQNYNDSFELKTLHWDDIIKEINHNKCGDVEFFYELCEQFFSDYEQRVGYFEWRNTEN